MIEAKNIRLDGDLLSLKYKSGLDDEYQKLVFNIKTDEIIETSVQNATKYRNSIIHAHLIKPLIKKIENNELKEEYTNIWY